MFSAVRLHTFVCLALGIAVSAAPAGSSGANVDARSPDIYDLTGGVGALLFGYPEGYVGASDEDAYILKRQLAGLDLGSRLGSNLGIQHAAALAAGAGLTTDTVPIESIPKRDLYDLSGGIGALLFGGEVEGGEGSDEYILRRQLAGLDIGSRIGSNLGIQHAAALAAGAGLTTNVGPVGSVPKRDLYDLTGGVGALLFGGDIEGGEESDEYILKRQLAGLDIGSRLGSNLGIQHAATLAAGAGLSTNVNPVQSIPERDLYDLTGGIGALLLGGDIEGGEDSDEYILKRQLAGSRLGSNMGIQHAVTLVEAGLGLGDNVDSISERDTYDLTGGIGALLLGEHEGFGGDEDVYILKRTASEVEARSPDVYDLTGGLGALLFGIPEGYGGDGDEDVYVLKRQLEGLGLGGAALLLNGTDTSTDTAVEGIDPNSILSGLGGSAELASSLGIGH